MRISDATGVLTSAYIDWDHLLVNPNYVRRDREITWNRYESHFISGPITSADIARLVEARQYTFQILDDGSIIQLYYSYSQNGDSVESARLAYFESSGENRLESYFQSEEGSVTEPPEIDAHIEAESEDAESEDLPGFEPHSVLADRVKNVLPPRWLRIDYNATARKGVLHHDCHMHISGFPDCRLPVRGLPNPRQFIEFILATCYSEQYRSHRLNEEGAHADPEAMQGFNSRSLVIDDSHLFRYVTHLQIPGR